MKKENQNEKPLYEKEFVTYDEVEEFVEALKAHCDKIGFKPIGVFGLPRGGLVPAVMASHIFGIPMLMAQAEGCLIIDDIADTGKSLQHFSVNETQVNKFFIATMFYHKRSIVKPDFYVKEKTDKAWIVFPWERDADKFVNRKGAC